LINRKEEEEKTIIKANQKLEEINEELKVFNS